MGAYYKVMFLFFILDFALLSLIGTSETTNCPCKTTKTALKMKEKKCWNSSLHRDCSIFISHFFSEAS